MISYKVIETFSTQEELISWISQQRWFLSKGYKIKSVKFEDYLLEKLDEDFLLMSIVKIVTERMIDQDYFLPLYITQQFKKNPISKMKINGIDFFVFDATEFKSFFSYLSCRLFSNYKAKSNFGSNVWFHNIRRLCLPNDRVKKFTGEMSNEVVLVGSRLVLKIYRKLNKGVNPELEINIGLSKLKSAPIAELVGYITFGDYVLGIGFKYVKNYGDLWDYAIKKVKVLFCRHDFSSINGFLNEVEKLGKTTADFHISLAKIFDAEKMKNEDIFLLTNSIKKCLKETKLLCKRKRIFLPFEKILFMIKKYKFIKSPGMKIRIHGDYHLEQILKTDRGFCIIDISGEPLRDLEEIRMKYSPLRDVAGILRSFDYVAWYVYFKSKVKPKMELMNKWYELTACRFLKGYTKRMKNFSSKLLPEDKESFDFLLNLLLLEKVLYELKYEISSRPDWIKIPLAGIKKL